MTHEQRALSLICVSANGNVRQSLVSSAEQSGFFHPINSFADGRFALEHLWDWIQDGKEPAPDVLITDLRVDGLTGPQLLREVRRYEELRPMFLAVVTSVGGPLELDAVENAGADFALRYSSMPWPSPNTLQAIAFRSLAKALPRSVSATRLCCGRLDGVGIEVPFQSGAIPTPIEVSEPVYSDISR